MVVYTVSDAYEFKDDNLEADRDTLIFIIFYKHHDKYILDAVKTLSEDPAYSGCKFHSSDVDESDELADEYHVKHYPTIIMLKAAEVVAKLPTPRDMGVIREFLEKNL